MLYGEVLLMKERSNLSKSRRSCIKRGVVFGERLSYRGGNVAQVVEHRTGTPLIQVQFPDAARHFSPRVNFQRRLFYSVRTFLCAVACLNSCAHIRDPVVHVRVQWIMETLKHPACSVSWVAWLLQLAFAGESNLNFSLDQSQWGDRVV